MFNTTPPVAEIFNGAYYTTWDWRLDQELRDRWIDALLDGERKQGRKMLVTPSGGFCCLVVLCDIEAVPYVLVPKEHEDASGNLLQNIQIRIYGGGDAPLVDGTYSYLPFDYAPDLFNSKGEKVCGFAGTEAVLSVKPQGLEGLPLWDDRCKGYSLADLNDQGFTFTQIADVIRYFL